MTDPSPATSAAATFSRSPRDDSVLVADGYGLRLTVHRGHLLVSDGIGLHRRERLLPRAQRDVERIVILGHTGSLTLDAIRWCADVGIALVQIDTDGRVLLVGANPARTDARLLCAQAAAAGSEVGVTIAQRLLVAKIEGHAAIAADELAAPDLSAVLRRFSQDLEHADDLPSCRDLEAQAANVYFAAWTAVGCRFTRQDVNRVPQHWHQFDVRTSPLNRGGHSPRKAADAINALLNYGYALAEAEARLAALTVRLDPGLGVIHTDRKDRDSLALDLLEPLRRGRTARPSPARRTPPNCWRCGRNPGRAMPASAPTYPRVRRTAVTRTVSGRRQARRSRRASAGRQQPQHHPAPVAAEPRQHGAGPDPRQPYSYSESSASGKAAAHLPEVRRRPLRQRPQALPHLLASSAEGVRAAARQDSRQATGGESEAEGGGTVRRVDAEAVPGRDPAGA